MNLETFFEKFEVFADAPDAVRKMRELVLQLAVQGKLVDQKRSEGTAAELLAAISSETETQAAKLRTPDDELASADSVDHAFSVPVNWAWTKLGRIARRIQYGYTASADSSATEIRMLRITDIQNNRVDWSSVPGCQIESDEAEKYLLSPDDILIARTGGTIGKSFIVPDAPVKSVFASYLIRVTPPRSMEARYLKTFLEAPLYWAQLRRMSAGTGQPNVNGQALGRLALPIPPRAEQKRIVAKVDELMGLCDRLEAQQEERQTRHTALVRASLARFADAPTPANFDFLFHKSYSIPPSELRKAILTLAVQGRLVEQDPRDEPVERSFPRLASAAFETEDGALPRQWLSVPLEQWGEWLGGGTPSKSRAEFWKGDIPWVSPKDMKVLHISDAQDHISDAAVKESSVRIIPAGSLLMVVRGMILARAFPVALTTAEVTINQDMKAIVPHEPETREFLLMALQAFEPNILSSIERSSHGTCKLKTDSVHAFAIPLPPLAEQRRIVAKVNQLIALVDRLEATLATSLLKAEELTAAIVAELTMQE